MAFNLDQLSIFYEQVQFPTAWNSLKNISVFSFSTRPLIVSGLQKELFLRSSRTIKFLSPKYQFYDCKVFEESFKVPYIKQYHKVSFLVNIGQRIRNRKVWLHFCDLTIHFLATNKSKYTLMSLCIIFLECI